MRRKISIFLSVIAVIIIVILVAYRVQNSHSNNELNWIGKTKNGDWVAEIHYSKSQKSYSGYAFWRGSHTKLKHIKNLSFKYYENNKMITSSTQNSTQGAYFSFLDFSSKPEGKAMLKFQYYLSGKKAEKQMTFQKSVYHYPFYNDNTAH